MSSCLQKRNFFCLFFVCVLYVCFLLWLQLIWLIYTKHSGSFLNVTSLPTVDVPCHPKLIIPCSVLGLSVGCCHNLLQNCSAVGGEGEIQWDPTTAQMCQWVRHGSQKWRRHHPPQLLRSFQENSIPGALTPIPLGSSIRFSASTSPSLFFYSL